MFTFRADRGEWIEIGATVTDPETKLPLDISGKTVTFTVRNGPRSTDTAATTDGKTAIVQDGAAGLAVVGCRIAAPGSYYATIAVGASTDGSGWPVVEMCAIKVSDTP